MRWMKQADYISAIKYLYENLFDEYNVFLDFAADNLGLEAVRERGETLYASIPKKTRIFIEKIKKR